MVTRALRKTSLQNKHLRCCEYIFFYVYVGHNVRQKSAPQGAHWTNCRELKICNECPGYHKKTTNVVI